jgi:hypothetical protein
MKSHSALFRLLIAGLLLPGSLPHAIAAPGPATPAVAPKPKLAPRPIPGMSGNSAPTLSRPRAPASRTVASKGPATTPAAGGAETARILGVLRSGSIALPPIAATPAAPPEFPDTGMIRPASLTTPRPGQVRIISKAQADALAAQPDQEK